MHSSTIKVLQTKVFQSHLTVIEDYVYSSSQRDYSLLSRFSDELENTIQFILTNPQTPPLHLETGDQSWPFSDGRYRLFYKFVKTRNESTIYLTELIDNRMLNQGIYPNNTLPTYDEEI